MKLSNIILRVTDLQRSVEFWADRVGLEVVAVHGQFAFLDLGSTVLVLNQVERPQQEATDTEIVFEVEDVGQVFTDMSNRGVPFEVAPRMVTTGDAGELHAAHFRDPDGHLASVTGWVEVGG